MRTYGTSETFNVTPSRIVNIIMLNMLVGMKDSNVKYVINDLAASQDKKLYIPDNINTALAKSKFINMAPIFGFRGDKYGPYFEF